MRYLPTRVAPRATVDRRPEPGPTAKHTRDDLRVLRTRRPASRVLSDRCASESVHDDSVAGSWRKRQTTSPMCYLVLHSYSVTQVTGGSDLALSLDIVAFVTRVLL